MNNIFLSRSSISQDLRSFPTRRSSDLNLILLILLLLGGARLIRQEISSLKGEHPPPARVQSSSRAPRSEEHTSELQSLAYFVCRLLRENKRFINTMKNINYTRSSISHD